MSELKNKQILIGISGGIAAYKSSELVRELKKQGANVQVCMTPSACEFITPLTLQALSGNPVHTQLLDPQAEAGMGHIELARWADLIVIAPASANTMAKLAQGMASDLLSTVCLASEAPIYLAPAMNRVMWENLATQANAYLLKQRGFNLLGPADGEQACGETGSGRMLEAFELAQLINQGIASNETPDKLGFNKTKNTDSVLKAPLQDKQVLITAGPTREAIDPVRFISNRSSGKMGYALAEAARDLGANVTLISGPVSLDAPQGVKRIFVESAKEMHEATLKYAASSDIFIASAAVADYSPKHIAKQKIKKTPFTKQTLEPLALKYNADILSDTSHNYPDLFTVGFAAETENLVKNASEKLKRKKLDMIIANLVGENKGFDQDTNQVEIIWQQGQASLPKKSKTLLAQDILHLIVKQYKNHPVLV